MHNTAIILPIYNEVESIDFVIKDLSAVSAQCIAVNDCSSDDSFFMLKAKKKIIVLDLPCNLGIGGAVQTGLKYARDNNFQYAVKFDGDGQHRACDIEVLLRPLREGDADIVIGSRFFCCNKGYRSTFLRRIGIKLFQLINWIVIGKNITDSTSGFRAYNRKAIEYFAENYPSFDYPEPEEVVVAFKKGLIIKEVAVEMRERQGGVSSISPLTSIYYMIKVILSIFIIAIRPRS